RRLSCLPPIANPASIVKSCRRLRAATRWRHCSRRAALRSSASPLSEKLDSLKRLEDAGASAIVLHSLFEEQIRADGAESETDLTQGIHSAADAIPGFPAPGEFALA